jgi:hypothetical protein
MVTHVVRRWAPNLNPLATRYQVVTARIPKGRGKMATRCTCEERRGEAPAPDGEAGAGSVAICPQCGSPIRAAGAADALLAKLSQLARFGLAAEDGPLLEPNLEGR